jgi:ribonucleoside-diphosphate reductase alpha chain
MHAWRLGISEPVKTRAIAPTGSIAILAETTSGCEPLFCVAYKRRYLKGSSWNYQYVIDPIAKRLIESGVRPEDIEDAYTLAQEPERRVAFQAWLQSFVDHGISSTINLPAWGTEFNNESRVRSFGDMLFQHLPSLRGITCYPDGSRSGQPLTTVSWETAMKHEGQIFIEQKDICEIGGGSCGS